MRRKIDKEEAVTAVIPFDPVNEQVVISAALVDTETRVALIKRITSDVFQDKTHKIIWATLTDLTRKGLEFDTATMQQLSGGEVSSEYVAVLMENRPEVPPNLEYHIDCLFWDQARVKLVTGPLAALLEAVRNPNESQERLRALAEQVPGALTDYKERQYLLDNNDVIREMSKDLQARLEGKAVYPYGIPGLDKYEDGSTRMLPAAKPEQITVISGLSGSGKSTFTGWVGLGLARQKKRILWGVWEQNAPITLELLAGFSLRIPRNDLITGNYGRDTIVAIEERAHMIGQYIKFMGNPFFNAKGKPSNERNLDLIHRYIEDTGCDIFIADLWRKCLVDFRPEAEEMALNRQQWIAQKTKTHHILIQQLLLKDVEKRQDKRPTREAIKGSGAWTEVADTIIGIHRPAIWKPVPESLEAIVLKQRYGKWPEAVSFEFDPSTGFLDGGSTIKFDALEGNEVDDDIIPGAPRKGLGRFKEPYHGQKSRLQMQV